MIASAQISVYPLPAELRLGPAIEIVRGALAAHGLEPQVGRLRSAAELQALAQAARLTVERVTGAVYYPRSVRVARLMAPIDPTLGELTTVGAAFVALRAIKAGGDGRLAVDQGRAPAGSPRP